MQKTLDLSSLKRSKSDGDSSFKVLIAYEDFETGKLGKKTYDFLIQNLGDQFCFENQMWKFDVLAMPKLREMAAKDAAEADLIFIAAHGRTDLPVEVKSWIEQWLSENLRAMALVALLDASDAPNSPARDYLEATARRAHIEFFCQPGFWPKSDDDQTFGDWESPSQAFAHLAGITEQHREGSHWGINE